MDMPITGQQDGVSNYGSDFSPEEEEILNGLLHQSPEQDDGPNKDPDLLLQDIEHDQSPRGARVPLRQCAKNTLSLSSQKSVAIQFDGDNGPSANSRCPARWPD